jgi:hypothetical protein
VPIVSPLRLLAIAALAGASYVAGAAESGLKLDGARQRDATTKRCHAAQRRVERQKQVIAVLDTRIARERGTRERCEKRACERIDRALKASQARRVHHERQLRAYEVDASNACPASGPR